MIHTKADIKLHAVGLGSPVPAINVKVYHLPDEQEIAKRLGLEADVAKEELEFEVELQAYIFWDKTLPRLVRQKLRNHFPKASAHSEGYSSGWVVVTGIGVKWEVLEGWDAIDFTAWKLFEAAVSDTVKRISSANYLAQAIGERLGLCKHCYSSETTYHQYVCGGRVRCDDCGEWQ